MFSLEFMDLTNLQIALVVLASFMIGFSKTGIGGVIMLVVPVVASVFGGKNSTGVILSMFIVGDIFAAFYYRNSVKWGEISKILIWTILGLGIGAFVGNSIDDAQFKALIAFIVLCCLGTMIFMEFRSESVSFPEKTWIYAIFGILSGFASMIGNAAGPIFTIYILSKRFKKVDFLGTCAYYFFIGNVIKMPFQIFAWHNVGLDTLKLTIIMIPFIALGAFVGAKVIQMINEKYFRYIVILMTVVAAVRLIIV